jgi:phosphate/sulfate permease
MAFVVGAAIGAIIVVIILLRSSVGRELSSKVGAGWTIFGAVGIVLVSVFLSTAREFRLPTEQRVKQNMIKGCQDAGASLRDCQDTWRFVGREAHRKGLAVLKRTRKKEDYGRVMMQHMMNPDSYYSLHLYQCEAQGGEQDACAEYWQEERRDEVAWDLNQSSRRHMR